MSQKQAWFFTLNENENYELSDQATIEKFIKHLQQHCKSFRFQLEKGEEEERLHYQGKFSLKKARRKTELLNKHFKAWNKGNSLTLQILHSEEGSDKYTCKEETRIKGPFDSKDIPDYIPRQVREIKELREWQQTIIDSANVWDTRTINVIVDEKGNVGKTTITSYIQAHKIGKQIPFINDFKDLMRIVMDMPVQKLYLIDMPRAIPKTKLRNIYSAIEKLKDGYAFDDRYHYKEKLFDCPNIWVFTNTKPDLEYLSSDRWRLWKIVGNKLVKLHGVDTTPSDPAPARPAEQSQPSPQTHGVPLRLGVTIPDPRDDELYVPVDVIMKMLK